MRNKPFSSPASMETGNQERRAAFNDDEAYGLYIGSENRRWFEHFGIPQERLFFAPYTADNELLQKKRPRLISSQAGTQAVFWDSGRASTHCRCRSLRPKEATARPARGFPSFARNSVLRPPLSRVGSLESQMREKVEREGIPDVTFAGFLNQQEIRRAYAAADIFVLASMEHETWGLVVNEAMNFSLPIVVTDAVGSATDLVRDGENGYVVSRCSIDELTASLSRLVDSPDRRMSFGRASLKRIQPWNYDLAADGVTAAIRRSVGGTGAR